MSQVTRVMVCASVLGLMAAAPASAQEPLYRGLFNLNVGAQATSRTLDELRTFDLYDETGTVSGSRKVGTGVWFEASAGYKVWKRLFVAAGYSYFTDKSDLALDARVPDPLHYDRPRAASFRLGGAAQTEQAAHLQFLWAFNLTEKLDVMVGGGPSFYFLDQDVLGELQANEGSELTVTGSKKSVSESGVGYNVGADLAYLLTERLGAGLLLRYSEATVEMPAGPGVTRDVKVGGFQVGAGLRFRF